MGAVVLLGKTAAEETEYKGLQLSLDQATSKRRQRRKHHHHHRRRRRRRCPPLHPRRRPPDPQGRPRVSAGRHASPGKADSCRRFVYAVGFQAERSDQSDQDSPWAGSPLTDSASPRLLEQCEASESACAYRRPPDAGPRPACYGGPAPSEDHHHNQHHQHQHHLLANGHGHAHSLARGHANNQGCEQGRCEAGRYCPVCHQTLGALLIRSRQPARPQDHPWRPRGLHNSSCLRRLPSHLRRSVTRQLQPRRRFPATRDRSRDATASAPEPNSNVNRIRATQQDQKSEDSVLPAGRARHAAGPPR
ncbi:hypothetical protein CRUP_025239, partial [Coryphaenoides rupestris]